MKIRLLCTDGTKRSQSLKLLANKLSEQLGYKVWRSTKEKPNRLHLRYGQGLDKLSQYRWFKEQGLSTLDFTESAGEAREWLMDGHCVFSRQLLNASCGKGIIINDEGIELALAPVYTKYKKKKREFRVHLFRDVVVAVMEKKRRSNWNGPVESKIRNLANGFVFCSCGEEPNGIRELAVSAGKAVASDFKGVDIGYNEKLNELFVIEVNAAPGMEGSRIQQYSDTIISSL